MNTITLSASILSADFSHLADQIHSAEDAGVDWIHIDVMDGHFVPNITMGPFIVETCRRITGLPLDVHLMIEKPELHIQNFIDAGATYLSIHIEGNPNIYRTLQEIRAQGCHPSIVLNPGTPPQSIISVLPIVEMILVMSVNPGYSGQKFVAETPQKISTVREICQMNGFSPLIEVDGGINAATLPGCFQAGASIFVAATAIFLFPQGISAGVSTLRLAAD